ncbi:MAG: hypothetical protein PHY77_01855 [Desulfotomaculaceae bacterium]|nr:hypothetical protein [Desulfotomaculaceae bacterium]
MNTEKLRNQSELVRSLASTIHKKMMAPSAVRADIAGRDIQQINQKLAMLEKELSHLNRYCRLTRFLALSLAAVAAFLALLLFYTVT